MSTRWTAARRYAGAIYQLARQSNAVDRIGEELQAIFDLTRESRDLQRFIDGGIGDSLSRRSAIKALFASRVHPALLNLLLLLDEKRRWRLFPELVEAYQRKVDADHGIVRMSILTAHPLTPAQRQSIDQRFGDKLNRTVVSTVRSDPALLGGFIVRAGDVVFDASAASQLKRFHRELVTAL
ncbi:MAG TPA: ATP synthase F1 subunit delta [Kiritimatiellia bacterium]|nr:ATP synthase F1 subunit delta [Kiritimatiellia bacterium]